MDVTSSECHTVFSLLGKIDMVKSKWGLALAAVVTVLSSLLMSVGLCTLFGLTPTLNGGYGEKLACTHTHHTPHTHLYSTTHACAIM